MEVDADLQRDKIELEQNIFELQAQLEDARVKLNDTTRFCEDLRLRVESAELARDEKTKWTQELENVKDRLESEMAEFKRQNKALVQDKQILLKASDDKSEEINRLQDEKRELKNELSNLYAQKCTQQAKLDDIKTREVMLEHKEKRWEQEKSFVLQEKEFAYGQMLEKERLVQQLRRDVSTKVMERQTQLDVANNENARLFNQVRSLTDEGESLKQQCEELNVKVKQATELNADLQAKHDQEILCQSKLVAVHKESGEEAEKKVAELTKALEDIQNLFVETKDAHFAMQEQIKSMETERTKIVLDKDSEIKELKDELEKANELLRSKHRVTLSDEEIAALSPGAAAASKLIKSGHTLTQIYREHIKLVEELDNQKLENKRLEQYFRELVQDIEQKAPLLKRQQEEFYRAMESIEQMKLQLLKAEQDQTRLMSEKDNCLRQLTYTKAELERYQRDNGDLTSQVRELLRCIEKIRRGDYDSISGRLDDGTLTPEDLLLYRNIDELQAQNQRLLSALREAEAKREEIIKAAQDAEMSRMKNELLLAVQELDDVKNSREKEAKLMRAVAEQRDTYERLLLEKMAGTVSSKTSDSCQPASGPDSDQKTGGELRAAMEKLNTEFEVYREQKGSVEKMLNEKIDKLQTDLSESRSTNGKLNAEVEFQSERFRILEKNIDTYKNEIKSLRDRNEKYTITLAKQEEAINSLTRDLLQSKEDIGKLKAEKNLLQDRFEQAHSKENRLDQELQMLRQNSYSQQMLNATLTELQARLERTEAEHTLKLKIDLETAVKERERLQESLMKATQNQDILVKEHLTKVADLEARLKDEKRNVERLQSHVENTVRQLDDAQSRCKLFREELDSSRASREDGGLERYQKEAQQLQVRLNYMEMKYTEASQKAESLDEELKRSKRQIEESRSLSSSLETGLEDHKKTMNVERQLLSSKVTEQQKEMEDLRTDNLSLEERLANVESEKQKMALESDQKIAQLDREKRLLSQTLAGTKQDFDKCSAREIQLKADLAYQIEQNTELKRSWNAANAKIRTLEAELESNKVKLEEFRQNLNQTNGKLAEFQSIAQNHEQIVDQIKADYESRVKELSEKSQQLEDSNTKLTEQIDKLASSYSALERVHMASAESVEELPSVQSIQENSAQSLNEIIRHLTEERVQRATRLQLAEMNEQRLKSREKMLEQEIADLSQRLKAAQEMANSAEQIASEKTQLLTRLAEMNSVREANKTLLQEKENLEKSIGALKQTISVNEENLASMVLTHAHFKADIEQLNANLEAAKKDNENWKGKYSELVESRARFEATEVNQLRSELSDALKKSSALDLQLISVKSENASIKTAYDTLEQSKNGLAAQLEESRQQTKILISKSDALRKIAVSKKNVLATANEELERIKKDYQDLQKIHELCNTSAKDVASTDVEKQTTAELVGLEQKYAEAQSQVERLSKEKEKLEDDNAQLRGTAHESTCRVKLLEDLLDKAKLLGEKSAEQHLQKPGLDKPGLESKSSPKPTPVQPVQAFMSDRAQTSGVSRCQLRQGQTVASIPPMNRAKTTAAVPPTTVSVSPTVPDQSFSAMSSQSHQQHTNAVSTSTNSATLQHAVPQLSGAQGLPQAVVYPSTDYALSDEPPEVIESRNNQASVISSSSTITALGGTPQDLQDFQALSQDIGAPPRPSKRRQSFSETTELMGIPKRRAISPEQVTTSSQPGPSGILGEHSIPEDLEIIAEEETDIVQAARRQIVGSSDSNDNEDNEVIMLEDTFDKSYDNVVFDDGERELEFSEKVAYNVQEDEEEAAGGSETPTLRTFELVQSGPEHLAAAHFVQDIFEADYDDVSLTVGQSEKILDNEAAASSVIESLQPMMMPTYSIPTQLDVQQPQSSGQADINIDSSADIVAEETTSEAIAVEQGQEEVCEAVRLKSPVKPQPAKPGKRQLRRHPPQHERLAAQTDQQPQPGQDSAPSTSMTSTAAAGDSTSARGCPISARVSSRSILRRGKQFRAP